MIGSAIDAFLNKKFANIYYLVYILFLNIFSSLKARIFVGQFSMILLHA